MALYIHVVSATKTPENRGSSESPFEEHASDPNDGIRFGPGERTMFLPVIEPAKPGDTVAEYYDPTYTDDVDGNPVRGVYVAGPPEEWHFSWNQVPRTLEEAKDYQSVLLEDSYLARLDAGFVDDGAGGSGKVFELSEIYFGRLEHKAGWYVRAQSDGVIPAGRKVSTFAADSTRVQHNNLSQFTDFVNLYGLTFDDINEHYYEKADAIVNAGNVNQVGNVTWDFNQF